MRILVLSGFGISSTYPNPICVRKITEKLSAYPNIEINVACDGLVEKTQVLDWKRHPIYMLRRIKRWPSYNPDVEKACRQELFDILNREKYDCIFVPHKPFETVYAACKAKERYPDIKLCIYALDPIANEIDANNGIGKHLFFLTEKAEKDVFKKADYVFQMECNRKKYSQGKYQKFANKFIYLDFPLIEEQHEVIKESATDPSTDRIILLYSGALDDTYRSPKYLLEVFDYVSKQMKNVELHFYAKGNSVASIEQECRRNEQIKSLGYIPKKKWREKLKKQVC